MAMLVIIRGYPPVVKLGQVELLHGLLQQQLFPFMPKGAQMLLGSVGKMIPRLGRTLFSGSAHSFIWESKMK